MKSKPKSLLKFNLTIKKKLITVSILLLTIPLMILGTISYEQSKNNLEEIGITNLKNSVEMTIEMISALNSEVEKGTLSLEEAQEKVKVAVLGEKNENGIRPINKNIDLGENGYIFILDEDGTLLGHPSAEGKNNYKNPDAKGFMSTQAIVKKGIEGGGITYFHWALPFDENKIGEKVTYSKQDPDWGWIIASGTYMMDFNQPANGILKLIAIVIGITLLVGIFIISMFTNNISKPIRKVSEHMNYLANGDLSQDQIQIKSKDETGQLASAMNNLQIRLKDIISNVAKASEMITSQSEELSQSANEVKAGSEQVAVTMQELANGTESQANSASDLSAIMEIFATKMYEANQNGEEIFNSSNGVLSMTTEGAKLMEASVKQMDTIDHIVQDAVQKVKGLDVQSQEISKLVSVIKDIADQTNLLALNAAIEAARAGEHGKGFAVVADEVRKLAEQVGISVTDITGIVKKIQSESTGVAESLQGGYEEVAKGTHQIETTGETFNKINNAVQAMVNKIQSVTDTLSSMSSSSQEMSSSVEEIASVAEESAAGVEETSASAQQTSSSMVEVSHSSAELAKLAEELNGVVRQFKL